MKRRVRIIFETRRATIKLAKRLHYEKPELTLEMLVLELTRRGCVNVRGGPLTPASVRTLLGGERVKPRLKPEVEQEIRAAREAGFSVVSLSRKFNLPRSVILQARGDGSAKKSAD